MLLGDLRKFVAISEIKGDENTPFSGIAFDSRKVQAGDLFLCMEGFTVDGHNYAAKAASQGAVALIVERWLDDVNLPQLKVKDSRLAMAIISNVFFDYPSHKMGVIGVTGTNGKTTTTHLIEAILQDHHKNVGLIGTISRRFNGQSFTSSGTTPECLDLQHYMQEMVSANVDYCVMEASSHALEQGRLKGIHFRTAVFTNMTQDHLDYHKTMEEYTHAKGLLFSRLGNSYSENLAERSYAVLNNDDPASEYFKKITSAEVITYAVEQDADVKASNIAITAKGTSFHVASPWGEADISLQMVGKFNVYNALAAMTAALLEGLTIAEIKQSLEQVPGVEGRVEAVNEGQDFAVLVDYAHTPDGLENVLRTVKEFAVGKVITVFGCGGDRDRTKRPIMAKIAAEYSDYVVVTSDNPRTEDPNFILQEVEAGLIEMNADKEHYELLVDRREAINHAIEMASHNDVVLIAGKGHETYQLIGTAVLDFDDRVVAREAIRGRLV
ncbi:UDP-N-acetylmuramoyl-L-alanyl-D-glutamate--2,6-diaminopimelate ligase [Paenibacillus turicensis]|uniref:UDP-N-acetylmuramoyl-L-alanyl-D-glutamate--2,6-diaminopimelate ligase n=1 Tax=Paenibacillus turicensis TaxID=160487 RepID=A0ABS4FP64_9BACL|nr:UDP-N-acetylmuramoyl-L-alanyl-D-glutamate--2,6-diaminopimelate ligase [Paenibacillus turicensis]MBP1904372.1 UDP-N-acetylmuramoyl-L-alanyl-D-glutamate--2,6-diaminopimelate ligase [Paenibacillus turicensis]